MDHYEFLDSGNLQRLERFGKHLLVRPCAQALWKPSLGQDVWRQADATFSREDTRKDTRKDTQGWSCRKPLPEQWTVQFSGLTFKVATTDFGHVGLFPEHSLVWDAVRRNIRMHKRRLSILNLFAYSGGATLAAAASGAQVCHLDASKGMVSWARENASLNHLEGIRWIVDDVMKFLTREIKRGVLYDGIILDPPTFGRGNRGEIFKIEKEIQPLLQLCRGVLSNQAAFVFFTSHTPGVTPKVLHHLLSQMMQGTKGEIQESELLLIGKQHALPSGSMAGWTSL